MEMSMKLLDTNLTENYKYPFTVYFGTTCIVKSAINKYKYTTI